MDLGLLFNGRPGSLVYRSLPLLFPFKTAEHKLVRWETHNVWGFQVPESINPMIWDE